MDFSGRTPKDLTPNPLNQLQETLRGGYLDLTVSNPTLCGLDYPRDLLTPLGDPSGLTYEPDPFGTPSAREALSAYLENKGLKVHPSRILISSGTSEAFSYVLKLLGNPGETILVPNPGYPLFEYLARLEGLATLPYRHHANPGWPLDQDSFPKKPIQGIRGVVAVSPQNPTGCFLSQEDTRFLMDFCAKYNAALLLDEVFSDFGADALPAIPRDVLSFRFGGLSKSLGLPQLKLSWTILDGPTGLIEEARERLEFISDSYLSVSTPLQKALPKLLEWAPMLQRRIRDRVDVNRRFLQEAFKGKFGVKVWPPEGGWYGLVEVLGGKDDQDLALDLLDKARVLVHPGMYFDFPHGSFLVLSLLTREDQFWKGVTKILEYLEKDTGG